MLVYRHLGLIAQIFIISQSPLNRFDLDPPIHQSITKVSQQFDQTTKMSHLFKALLLYILLQILKTFQLAHHHLVITK